MSVQVPIGISSLFEDNDVQLFRKIPETEIMNRTPYEEDSVLFKLQPTNILRQVPSVSGLCFQENIYCKETYSKITKKIFLYMYIIVFKKG